jgi:predicted phosphodiesterase
MTDLHLEFGPIYPYPHGDYLLLAGDIMVAAYLKRNDFAAVRKHNEVVTEFFHNHCKNWKHVYMIMGNHEHYNGDFKKTQPVLQEFLAGTNVTLLENAHVLFDNDVALFGATLWTDFKNDDWATKYLAKERMNDYAIIGNFNTKIVYEQNQYTRNHLEAILRQYPDKKWIVMTHHGFFLTKPVNDLDYAYFNTKMEWLLGHNVKYLLHGHTHESYDYMAGDARVLVNPRGYTKYEENPEFKPDLVFEI